MSAAALSFRWRKPDPSERHLSACALPHLTPAESGNTSRLDPPDPRQLLPFQRLTLAATPGYVTGGFSVGYTATGQIVVGNSPSWRDPPAPNALGITRRGCLGGRVHAPLGRGCSGRVTAKRTRRDLFAKHNIYS